MRSEVGQLIYQLIGDVRQLEISLNYIADKKRDESFWSFLNLKRVRREAQETLLTLREIRNLRECSEYCAGESDNPTWSDTLEQHVISKKMAKYLDDPQESESGK